VTVYIDTSALLRLVLREPGALDELRSSQLLVSSELLAVESSRTLDRLRLQGSLTTDEAAVRVGSSPSGSKRLTSCCCAQRC